MENEKSQGDSSDCICAAAANGEDSSDISLCGRAIVKRHQIINNGKVSNSNSFESFHSGTLVASPEKHPSRPRRTQIDNESYGDIDFKKEIMVNYLLGGQSWGEQPSDDDNSSQRSPVRINESIITSAADISLHQKGSQIHQNTVERANCQIGRSSANSSRKMSMKNEYITSHPRYRDTVSESETKSHKTTEEIQSQLGFSHQSLHSQYTPSFSSGILGRLDLSDLNVLHDGSNETYSPANKPELSNQGLAEGNGKTFSDILTRIRSTARADDDMPARPYIDRQNTDGRRSPRVEITASLLDRALEMIRDRQLEKNGIQDLPKSQSASGKQRSHPTPPPKKPTTLKDLDELFQASRNKANALPDQPTQIYGDTSAPPQKVGPQVPVNNPSELSNPQKIEPLQTNPGLGSRQAYVTPNQEDIRLIPNVSHGVNYGQLGDALVTRHREETPAVQPTIDQFTMMNVTNYPLPPETAPPPPPLFQESFGQEIHGPPSPLFESQDPSPPQIASPRPVAEEKPFKSLRDFLLPPRQEQTVTPRLKPLPPPPPPKLKSVHPQIKTLLPPIAKPNIRPSARYAPPAPAPSPPPFSPPPPPLSLATSIQVVPSAIMQRPIQEPEPQFYGGMADSMQSCDYGDGIIFDDFGAQEQFVPLKSSNIPQVHNSTPTPALLGSEIARKSAVGNQNMDPIKWAVAPEDSKKSKQSRFPWARKQLGMGTGPGKSPNAPATSTKPGFPSQIDARKRPSLMNETSTAETPAVPTKLAGLNTLATPTRITRPNLPAVPRTPASPSPLRQRSAQVADSRDPNGDKLGANAGKLTQSRLQNRSQVSAPLAGNTISAVKAQEKSRFPLFSRKQRQVGNSDKVQVYAGEAYGDPNDWRTATLLKPIGTITGSTVPRPRQMHRGPNPPTRGSSISSPAAIPVQSSTPERTSKPSLLSRKFSLAGATSPISRTASSASWKPLDDQKPMSKPTGASTRNLPKVGSLSVSLNQKPLPAIPAPVSAPALSSLSSRALSGKGKSRAVDSGVISASPSVRPQPSVFARLRSTSSNRSPLSRASSVRPSTFQPLLSPFRSRSAQIPQNNPRHFLSPAQETPPSEIVSGPKSLSSKNSKKTLGTPFFTPNSKVLSHHSTPVRRPSVTPQQAQRPHNTLQKALSLSFARSKNITATDPPLQNASSVRSVPLPKLTSRPGNVRARKDLVPMMAPPMRARSLAPIPIAKTKAPTSPRSLFGGSNKTTQSTPSVFAGPSHSRSKKTAWRTPKLSSVNASEMSRSLGVSSLSGKGPKKSYGGSSRNVRNSGSARRKRRR